MQQGFGQHGGQQGLGQQGGQQGGGQQGMQQGGGGHLLTGQGFSQVGIEHRRGDC